jgi:hypothetical protein
MLEFCETCDARTLLKKLGSGGIKNRFVEKVWFLRLERSQTRRMKNAITFKMIIAMLLTRASRQYLL